MDCGSAKAGGTECSIIKNLCWTENTCSFIHRPDMIVWVYGYFNKSNFGDDVFSWLFQHKLTTQSDDVKVVTINPSKKIWPHHTPLADRPEVVVVGGGDLINDYFMDLIRPLLDPETRTCPVYAVGVGIPFPGLVDQGYLDGFDYIIHRTFTQHDHLVDRYGAHHVHFSPDLAWSARAENSENVVSDRSFLMDWFPLPWCAKPDRRRVAFFLARPMLNADHPEKYQKIVESVADLVHHLTTAGLPHEETFYVDLIPMGTSDHHPDQDDRLMNDDVVAALKRKYETNHNLVRVLPQVPGGGGDPEKALHFFQRYDFAVCSRFHAHVFSMAAKVPFVSMACTLKVHDLLVHAGLDAAESTYRLPVDPEGLFPVECDSGRLIRAFESLVETEDQVREKLRLHANRCRQAVEKSWHIFHNLLHYQPRPVTRFHCTTRPALETALFLQRVSRPFSVAAHVPTAHEMIRPGGVYRLVQHWKDRKVPEPVMDDWRRRAARLASFLLTNNPDSEYLWGLEDNLFQPHYDLGAACAWVHHRELTETHGLVEFPDWKKYANRQLEIRPRAPQVNVEGYRWNYPLEKVKVHRSGWSYVMNHFSATFHQPGRGQPLFDGYVDETFGWKCQVLEDAGLIPYRQPWMGILHHTPNQELSDNNLVNVFSQPAFQMSLQVCRRLIVLSEYLAQWVRHELDEMGLVVQVVVWKHPTEFLMPFAGDQLFSFKRHVQQPERGIVQVGGWMRNTFGIYQLDVPDTLRKYALKGPRMDHLYLDQDQIMKLGLEIAKVFILPDGQPENVGGLCGLCSSDATRPPVWTLGAGKFLINDLHRRYDSVTLLENLSDADYDQLLSHMVVFVNLVDASAVNTVLECIVRNTPIFINALPAVVEYLGPDYPLYYRSIREASELTRDDRQWLKRVKQAHRYLKQMDKSTLRIEHYLEQASGTLSK